MESVTKKFENLINKNETQESKIISPSDIIKISEEMLETNNNITISHITKIKVKHAYCPECGNELKSKYPAMYNPFNGEKQCIHKCVKCDKVYNLEYAYPRIVFYDENNEEINVHCE